MAAGFAKCKQTIKTVSYLPQTSHTPHIWWCGCAGSAQLEFGAGVTRTIAKWMHDWCFARHPAALASCPPHSRSDDSCFWHVFSVLATNFRSHSSQGTVLATWEQGCCCLSCTAPSVVTYELLPCLSVAPTDLRRKFANRWPQMLVKHLDVLLRVHISLQKRQRACAEVRASVICHLSQSCWDFPSRKSLIFGGLPDLMLFSFDPLHGDAWKLAKLKLYFSRMFPLSCGHSCLVHSSKQLASSPLPPSPSSSPPCLQTRS